MNKIIELRNVTKKYNNQIILDSISFSLFNNEVVAIVGKNGSGKSTLLKLISGMAKTDFGQVKKHLNPLNIGFVPEILPTNLPFSPIEYLTYMGEIQKLSKEYVKKKVNELIELFQLNDKAESQIKDFSKGMKQKVLIMQALVGDADLLIMDEPLTGLDVKSQKDLGRILLKLKESGISIVFTCHETKLLENEILVDRVLLVKNQQIKEVSKTTNSNKLYKMMFTISSNDSIDDIHHFFISIKERYKESDSKQMEVTFPHPNTSSILKILLKKGASIEFLAPVNSFVDEFNRQ